MTWTIEFSREGLGHSPEQELHRAPGVRVAITDRNGKGKILIEYSSLEDFDRILEVMKAK